MFEHLEGYSQQLVEFVRIHEAWAAPIVFALAFGELLAFISLLIPAWAALVAIGALIASSKLNFWPIWVAGSVGAALGDWLSYWVGLKLGSPVAHVWPLSRHPESFPKVRHSCSAGARLQSSSVVSLGHCAPRSPSWPAFSKCIIGNSKSQILLRPSSGHGCCSLWATSSAGWSGGYGAKRSITS